MTIKTFPSNIKFNWLENTGHSSERGFQIIRNFLLFGFGNGILLNKKLFYITTLGLKNWKASLIKYLRHIFKTKIIFKSNLYILSDMWSDGPYHFHIDVLSKLIAFKEMNGSIEKMNIVLTKTDFNKNIGIAIIDYIKFKYENVIWLDKSQQYCILGQNYYLTKPLVMGSNNTLIINLLHNKMLSKLPILTSSKFNNKSKVYYYRKNRKRVVVNDDILIPILRKLDFYCTDFDDLSYLESRSLMMNVKVFIGIHGGGMTNMLFMSGDSNVIEIKTDNLNPQNHCYWHLARTLNFNYTMFVAQTIDDHNIIEGRGCDVSVDVNQMLHLLNKFE
jgi:hypothetical protein